MKPESAMNADEFRIRGKQLVDFIADYLETINQRRVTPNVDPGYLKAELPTQAPEESEDWDDIMHDFETKILTGITHWQHPRFHAYFPAGNCYPSILGEMLSAGLGIQGFSWAASPACTELETIVMNWMGKMIGLSDKFLPFQESEGDLKSNIGGGVILGSASECVLVAMLSARTDILKRLKENKRGQSSDDDASHLSKLVMYTSKLGHSCIEKAAMIGMVKIRMLDTDEKFSLRGHTLQKAINDDRKNGLIPFFVACTLGTTAVCSYDNLEEIGLVCSRESIYLHVDGAYAGNALICPELRKYAAGLELVDSFNFNPNKWMLMNFDCSCFWVKDKFKLTSALSVDPIYLRYKEMDKAIDYRHWGISLSRRFRALKMWFTIRSYGIKGLQSYIRKHVRLAKTFEECVRSDPRFEIVGEVTLGLVCFRLKGHNSLSENLLYLLNDSGKIHMVPAMLNNKYAIRFSVNSPKLNESDIKSAWDLIRNGLRRSSLQSSNGVSALMLKRRRFSTNRTASDPRTVLVETCNIVSSGRNRTQRHTLGCNQLFKSASIDSSSYLAHKCSVISHYNDPSDDEDN